MWCGIGWRGGKGRLCQPTAVVHRALEQWLGQQVDRRLVSTFFLGPVASWARWLTGPNGLLGRWPPGLGGHRASAPLSLRVVAQRAGRSYLLPDPGPGGDQASEQSAALSQVGSHFVAPVPVAPSRPSLVPAGGAGRVGLGDLGRERTEKDGEHRPGGDMPDPFQQGGPLKRTKPVYYHPPGEKPLRSCRACSGSSS